RNHLIAQIPEHFATGIHAGGCVAEHADRDASPGVKLDSLRCTPTDHAHDGRSGISDRDAADTINSGNIHNRRYEHDIGTSNLPRKVMGSQRAQAYLRYTEGNGLHRLEHNVSPTSAAHTDDACHHTGIYQFL